MPCFKGLAVSIHTPDGPLPEYSIQKQSRVSRITSYIPVPPPKLKAGSSSTRAEPSTFAISITLLTPGLNVPYSTPKATPDNPYPRPQYVSGLPTFTGDRGRYSSVIGPYVPLTTSPNETVAAYIYFDGRQKEEVATLLRRGEETWVNSRWVSVPESEGGGLAEREFLFREVGLERWLNGLDLEGKDVAAKIERRRQKMEKKRRKRKEDKGSDDEDVISRWGRPEKYDKGVLRYGDEEKPVEKLSDDSDLFSSDEDSDDDPIPEATGQIKVALFRVLASGEIKKGEYSPQFDAHDDDEDFKEANGNGANGESSGEADIDHTTSFAKPKTLDPKSISTQTVTGIDAPDKPYAVFTFLYRGEKQLQKMGILKSNKPSKPTATTAKRRSVQADFANLKPLKPGGALGFGKFRDGNDPRDTSKNNGLDAMESDDEDSIAPEKSGKLDDADGEDYKNHLLSPEDAKKQGELAEGVKKIKLKRQHSFEPPQPSPSAAPANRGKSTSGNNTPSGDSPPFLLSSTTYDPNAPALVDSDFGAQEKDLWGLGSIKREDDQTIIGSPLKKARASLSGLDSEFRKGDVSRVSGLGMALGFAGMSGEGERVGNDFGGELPRVSESGEASTGKGVEVNNVGPVAGIGAALAPLGSAREEKKEDAMEEEEL